MASRTRSKSKSLLSTLTQSTEHDVNRHCLKYNNGENTTGESFVLTDGQPVWVSDGVQCCPHAAIVVESPSKKLPNEVKIKWATTLLKETVQIARVSPMESRGKRMRGRVTNTESDNTSDDKKKPKHLKRQVVGNNKKIKDSNEPCIVSERENSSELDTSSFDKNPHKNVTNTNGYYEVDEILNRRVVSRGSGNIVEYLVSWKADYNPSWMVAENLDQNSLADAFRRFPAPGDPDMIDGDDKDALSGGDDEIDSNSDDELNVDLESASLEEAVAALPFSNDEDVSDDNDSILDFNFDDDDDEDDDEDQDKDTTEEGLKKGIAFLAESDYDKPGTAELVLNRKCYRVGQSYYESDVVYQSIIVTICELIPQKKIAVCTEYMKIENTFTTPKGMEGRYIQRKGTRAVQLSQLQKPCKYFRKYSTFQYEFDEKARSFAYFHNNGKTIDHFPKSKPQSLDLFAGAGGVTIGFHNAGFASKWVVDNNQYAAATLRANVPQRDTTVYTESIEEFLKKSRKQSLGYPAVDEVDHIHASPPCKGFSRANICGGKDLWKNNQLSWQFVRAIKHFQPMTATFENVPGLLLPEYRHYLQGITSSLLGMKYQVRCGVLLASSFGDPQNRRRVILWAARKDCVLPAMPTPSHGPNLIPARSVKDAIQCLEEHAATSSGSGTIVCRGFVMCNHLCSKVRPSEDDFVVDPDKPARTILARARPSAHYKLNRYLSVREVACLQSFPPNFQFFGPIGEQYKQIGNAVPVRLATAVARSVAAVHGLP